MDPADEYKSPFNFEEGVNASYLYLSPSEVVTPPSSPLVAVRGAQRPDSLPEVGEDAVTTVDTTTSLGLTEEEQEELQNELAKVEEEIQTLSQVLAAKEKQVAELKRKLGITPLNELRQNLSKGWQEVTTSTAYRRTSETLSQAGQKASAAFSSVGSAITRKLDDVSIRSLQHSASMPVMRNTPTFKSFEEKVETLKTKMTPTSSTGNINEVINSTANSEAVESQSEGTEMKREEPH
ncbi:tumor protein D52 isoform X2 [Denticeps clupeoides]|uniref:tumor protein D52 isoform X2 n=1 Tax=Denticeps clupeoides TaxID=299321 RepID=UPI0010A44804|nr:tumor protein D52 isoform X2 [Denticeps clupeoides]